MHPHKAFPIIILIFVFQKKLKKPIRRIPHPVNEKDVLNKKLAVDRLPQPQGGGDEVGLIPPDLKQDILEREENGDANGKEDDNDKDDNVDGQLVMF